MILIPLSFCAFNVSCLFNGLVYYNQWHRFEFWQLMNVVFGVLVTIFGVLLLSWQQHKSETDEIGTLLSETERLATAADEDGFDGEQIIYAEEDYDDEDIDDDYALNNSQVNLLVKKKKNRHQLDIDGSIRL